MPRQKRRLEAAAEFEAKRPCTYDLGYVRQDLYACRKCMRDNSKRAFGFCAGCRHACHGDHAKDVIELYTKRFFRCDCGNARSGITCKLNSEKDADNGDNHYSHNFDSRYCRCEHKYDARLPMAQCAMCEDWFHEKCYEMSESFSSRQLDAEYELICKRCVATLPVLSEYHTTLNAWCTESDVSGWRSERLNKSGVSCVRPRNVTRTAEAGSVDLLWRPGFRVLLCRCTYCMQLYREAKAMYMVDRTDFVSPFVDETVEFANDGDDDDDVVELVEDEADGADGAEGAIPASPVKKRGKFNGMPFAAHSGAAGSGKVVSRADEAADSGSRGRAQGSGASQHGARHVANGVEHSAGRIGGGQMNGSSVEVIRERIRGYLRERVEQNDDRKMRVDLLNFVSELRSKLFATFSKQPAAAGR